MLDDISQAEKLLGTTVVGGGLLALFWRRLMTIFSREDVATAAARAEVGLIERLHFEISRLGAANDALVQQIDILRNQLSAMAQREDALIAELAQLRSDFERQKSASEKA